jgi:hypothetical protein
MRATVRAASSDEKESVEIGGVTPKCLEDDSATILTGVYDMYDDNEMHFHPLN